MFEENKVRLLARAAYADVRREVAFLGVTWSIGRECTALKLLREADQNLIALTEKSFADMGRRSAADISCGGNDGLGEYELLRLRLASVL